MAGDPACGPGGLEVEASGDAVDVEGFASEVESGDDAAFHGFEVNFGQGNASTGDEFLLVRAFSSNGKLGACEEGGQFESLWAGQASPFGLWSYAGLNDQ